MAKSPPLEQTQILLAELRDAPITPETGEQWRQVLQSPHASVITQAAKILGQRALTDFNADLAATFTRLMQKPVKRDPNCLAKATIADTLYRLESHNAALFLQGIRHVQQEPVWGGTVDTAATLRGNCALGLVRMHYPNVITELADLLADPEQPARIVAARAIAYSQDPQGIPLLRLRAKMGDEPQVLSEYLAALLKLAPQASLAFVAAFLQDTNQQVQELVALVLGESRQPEALDSLITWWHSIQDPELSVTGLLAIAMLRTDEALQFLLDLVAEGSEHTAQDAIKALEIYRQDYDLWQRVCEVQDHRNSQRE
ncbi:HEAT repeat domain-containing protein [Acaryochloris sp. IP29b_bin.148]|uniref:HEAT repeat domain-containing protein n=1 Tax=Acaryochloris sp. IP29b_bin.148 TaxID=2969218 RepID=UPI002622A285|nr:HEAT repeat domain-containing protein [Acaryochloris sp. IP29b_bin.148]